jgi:hypothetical protein
VCLLVGPGACVGGSSWHCRCSCRCPPRFKLGGRRLPLLLCSACHAPPRLECKQDTDNLPASEARRRLEAFRKKQQAAAAAKGATAGAEGSDGSGSGGGAASDGGAVAAAACAAFEGAISEAFEGSLKFYVTEEQKEVRPPAAVLCSCPAAAANTGLHFSRFTCRRSLA